MFQGEGAMSDKRNDCVSIFGLVGERFDARALMEFAPMLLIVEAVARTDRLIRFCMGRLSVSCHQTLVTSPFAGGMSDGVLLQLSTSPSTSIDIDAGGALAA